MFSLKKLHDEQKAQGDWNSVSALFLFKKEKVQVAQKENFEEKYTRNLWAEEKAQGDWNSVYMLIILAIAGLVVISLIKPMFRQSQKIVKNFKGN